MFACHNSCVAARDLAKLPARAPWRAKFLARAPATVRRNWTRSHAAGQNSCAGPGLAKVQQNRPRAPNAEQWAARALVGQIAVMDHLARVAHVTAIWSFRAAPTRNCACPCVNPACFIGAGVGAAAWEFWSPTGARGHDAALRAPFIWCGRRLADSAAVAWEFCSSSRVRPIAQWLQNRARQGVDEQNFKCEPTKVQKNRPRKSGYKCRSMGRAPSGAVVGHRARVAILVVSGGPTPELCLDTCGPVCFVRAGVDATAWEFCSSTGQFAALWAALISCARPTFAVFWGLPFFSNRIRVFFEQKISAR